MQEEKRCKQGPWEKGEGRTSSRERWSDHTPAASSHLHSLPCRASSGPRVGYSGMLWSSPSSLVQPEDWSSCMLEKGRVWRPPHPLPQAAVREGSPALVGLTAVLALAPGSGVALPWNSRFFRLASGITDELSPLLLSFTPGTTP